MILLRVIVSSASVLAISTETFQAHSSYAEVVLMCPRGYYIYPGYRLFFVTHYCQVDKISGSAEDSTKIRIQP